MKIGPPADKASPPAAPAVNVAGPNGPAGAAAAPSGSAAGPVDASATLALSSTAASLLDGRAETAEFDAEKVARIAAAIDAGTFRIDPAAIAGKLIANAREVLGEVPS